MSYSIKPILHHAADKNKLHKIQVLIIYNRWKLTLPTVYKVQKEQFINGRCTGFKNANAINKNILDKLQGYERTLLSVIEKKPSKEYLKQLLSSNAGLVSYTLAEYIEIVEERMKNKLSPGRLKHYKIVREQLKDIDLPLSNVNETALLRIEDYFKHLGNDNNTINAKMKIIGAVINKAIREKLLPTDCKDGYAVPRYVDPIPDYLTEHEISNFKKVVDAAINPDYKKAGYFFLLSCYTGYRIQALNTFDDKKAVKGDNIIIRAKKNFNIVSIPIYPKLAEILHVVKDYQFSFAEETMRRYVKELALMAGLGRKIKVHTARHTFAMMLIEKGFTIAEVAQLLGDSEKVARIYARISNTHLKNKFNALMH